MQALVEQKGVKHVLELAGSSGNYQIRAVSIIAWQYLFRSFFLIYYAYLTQTPIFLCKDENGVTYDCTESTGGCQEQIIAPHSPSSLVNDLGFYCEKSYIRNMGSSLFFVGGNIGVALLSYISDKYGRKPALTYAYLVGSTALLLLGVAARGAFTYILFLMLIWGGMSCFVTLSLTYVSEITGDQFNRKASATLLLSICGGELLIIFLAQFITNWQTLFIFAIGLPAFLTNFTFRALDESPVYLEMKGETAKAAEILNKIAFTNERAVPVNNLAVSDPKTSFKALNAPAKEEKAWNYVSILMHPKLQVSVFIYSLIRLFLNLAYFGCIFALSSLGGNLFVNTIIAIVAEGLGYALSMYSYLFQTKILLKYSLTLIIACGISFLLIPSISCESSFICGQLFLSSISSLIMRTAVCFAFGFIYSLGNEIFPTEVRSQCNGIAGVAQDLGGMVAPFIIVLAETLKVSPLCLFGLLGLLPLIGKQYIADKTIVIEDDVNNNNNDVEMHYMKMEDKEHVKA